jgi:hypothetical protein
MVFDIKTQKWSDLVSSSTTGYVADWTHSPDYKYVYYTTTSGAEPMVFRIRLADHEIETITSLKDLHLGTGPGGNTEISVAPDGSAVFTRNTGTQEIYSLTAKWPKSFLSWREQGLALIQLRSGLPRESASLDGLRSLMLTLPSNFLPISLFF